MQLRRNKRKTTAPAREAKAKKPRVTVGELRERNRQLQTQIDFLKGVQTADTNELEWRETDARNVASYRKFVAAASSKIGVPKSFLLEGIEDGSLTSWQQARHVHEESIHRAVQRAAAA